MQLFGVDCTSAVRSQQEPKAMTKSWILAAAATGALLCAGSAEAGSASAHLTVTATVAQTCGVTDAALSFGSLTASGTTLPVTGSISVTCSLGTPFTVGL